jgi:hypothetical protein
MSRAESLVIREEPIADAWRNHQTARLMQMAAPFHFSSDEITP